MRRPEAWRERRQQEEGAKDVLISWVCRNYSPRKHQGWSSEVPFTLRCEKEQDCCLCREIPSERKTRKKSEGSAGDTRHRRNGIACESSKRTVGADIRDCHDEGCDGRDARRGEARDGYLSTCRKREGGGEEVSRNSAEDTLQQGKLSATG